MSIGPCPDPKVECPYYNRPPKSDTGQNEIGCFADDDHRIPQRLGETVLHSLYLNLPQFIERKCRWDHEERNRRHDEGDTSDIPDFPSVSEMARAVMEAVTEDGFFVSQAKTRAIYEGLNE